MKTVDNYASEAISKFGYIKPEGLEWITGIIRQADEYGWGDASLKARSLGTPMPDTRRKSLKLGNLRMTEEAWNALTDEGKKQPAMALETTIKYAVVSYARDQHNADILSSDETDKIQIKAWNPCPEFTEAGLKNSVIEREDAPSFPLPNCSRDVCECRLQADYGSFRREQIDIPEPAVKQSSIARKIAKLIWNLFAIFGIFVALIILLR